MVLFPGSTILLNPKDSSIANTRGRGQSKLITPFSFTLLALILLGCSTDPSNPNINEDSINLMTTKTSYFSSDTITTRIENDSTNAYFFGLRCGEYLEMFYQKKLNGEWSENQWFWFMSLYCPTTIDSIISGETYEYDLPAEWFEDIGTFRLNVGELYSNQFKIE